MIYVNLLRIAETRKSRTTRGGQTFPACTLERERGRWWRPCGRTVASQTEGRTRPPPGRTRRWSCTQRCAQTGGPATRCPPNINRDNQRSGSDIHMDVLYFNCAFLDPDLKRKIAPKKWKIYVIALLLGQKVSVQISSDCNADQKLWNVQCFESGSANLY